MPHTIRLPKFSSNNPNLWFSQIERAFRLHGVTNDDDKFDHATVNLEAEFAVAVEDLLTHPPDANKYEILKNRLLDKFAKSPESKLRRLLQGGETTGFKPSEILAHMRRLAPESSSEPIVRSLFLSEMPQNIRPILTIWEENDLEKLAKIADKMQETVGAITLAISSNAAQLAGTVVPSVSPSDSLSDFARALRSLEKKVDTLQNDFKRLQSNNRSRVNQMSSHKLLHQLARMLNFVSITRRLGTMQRSVSHHAHASSRKTNTAAANNAERRLYINDCRSHIRFLIDSGSVVSVIPRTLAKQNIKQSNLILYAANGTTIPTYGNSVMKLNIGLRRCLTWPFIVADVRVAIIGADFLSQFQLLIDLTNKRLIDSTTGLTSSTGIADTEHFSISLVHGVSKFQSLLQEFVEVTIPARKTTSQHEVRHHIEVTGAPISDRPRRLAGEKLAIAKAEGCQKNDQRLIDWTANRIAAFEECKRSITNAALLAIVAALEQQVDDYWQPIGFFSKNLSNSERNYSTYDRELLSVKQIISRSSMLFDNDQKKHHQDNFVI
ncbi:hypothetical protein ACLKA6_016158 [Drosophila palustris]